MLSKSKEGDDETEYEPESDADEQMSDESAGEPDQQEDEPGPDTFAINDMKALKNEIDNFFRFNHAGSNPFDTTKLSRMLRDIQERWAEPIYAGMLVEDGFFEGLADDFKKAIADLLHILAETPYETGDFQRHVIDFFYTVTAKGTSMLHLKSVIAAEHKKINPILEFVERAPPGMTTIAKKLLKRLASMNLKPRNASTLELPPTRAVRQRTKSCRRDPKLMRMRSATDRSRLPSARVV